MNSARFIQWQDLFVLIDDGSLPGAKYDSFESAIREQAKMCPQGVALLCILPPEAKPPPDDVKRGVKSVLMRLAPSLSCLAYVIEGTGFRGVTARATLVGMKIFSSRPYPIYVETSVREALGKLLPHLAKGQTVTTDANAIMKQITEARVTWQVPPPAMGSDGELTLK